MATTMMPLFEWLERCVPWKMMVVMMITAARVTQPPGRTSGSRFGEGIAESGLS